MKCSICDSTSEIYTSKVILNKYSVKYYRCVNCKFIETEKPRYWLDEAYTTAIIDSDTGIVMRNQKLSKISAIFFLLFCNFKSKCLDYAGGYGLMTRMQRDIGVDGYWTDKYAKNIFANQFNDDKKSIYEMVTAFEYFEHIDNPIKEIKEIVKKYSPKVLLFSTELHDGTPDNNWWYFVESGGQHISLYTIKSLEILASKNKMKLSTNGTNIHIFSKIKIPTILMKIFTKYSNIFSVFFKIFYKSKTYTDHISLK